MSRDLDDLIPEFKEHIVTIIAEVKERGYEIRPFFTRRSIEEQARLWRQSRSSVEIRKAADRLVHEAAEYLAKVLLNVGPQHGRWATNALPGQSWHQWGKAVDCFAINEQGKAVWAAGYQAYEIYAEVARGRGLTAGFYWKRRDAVHVQYNSEGVRANYTWPEIDDEMRKQYGEIPPE